MTLLRDAAFRRYWAGQATSTLGDAFAMIAIPLLVLEATGSVAAMGLVSAAAAAAQLVTGLASGAIIDRYDRRRLMIACDLGRFVVFGALALACWLRGPSLALIYATAVVGSAMGTLFGVGYVTATAGLVEKSRLTEANGYLISSQAMTFVLGPLAAGALASRWGAATAIGVDALSFLVSAWSLAGLRFGRSGPTSDGGPLEGLRFLMRHPMLRALSVALLAISLLASEAGLIDLLIYHVRHDLGRDSSSVGIMLGSAAVGSLVAAVSVTWLRRRFGFGFCFLGGTFLQGVALLAAGRSPGFAPLVGFVILWAYGLMLRSVVTQTLRQEITPDAILGRVTAAFWTLALGAAPLGATAITAGAERWGTTRALTASGVCMLAVVGLAAFTPARRQRPERDARPPEPAGGEGPAAT
ncbi:MAG TPA: MFS transporter [Polyangiaceae bacterium]|nr:MFS transporter [Polyangiaceae bacterium]